MAYLPGFEHDIFISYAHLNNLKEGDGAKGWVTRFHERLEVELKQLVGNELKIWRDLELERNQLTDPTIKKAVDEAGVFVALNSIVYVKSDYCQQEVKWFCDKAQADGRSLSIGGRKRIFNVLLNNIPRKEWNTVFSDAECYEFYEEESGNKLAFTCDLDSDYFRKQIRLLARELFNTLNAFKDAIQKAPEPSSNGIAKEIVQKQSDLGPKPRLKSRIIFAASCIAILTALGVWRVMTRVPLPACKTAIFETEEEADIPKEKLPKWIPSNIGWDCGERGEGEKKAYGRSIKGDNVGLFKTKNTRNDFNMYQNFSLHFDVRFIGKKGVAWIVRAQDINNYYLFELSKSEKLGQSVLDFYRVEKGNAVLNTRDSRIVHIADVENDRDNFSITTEAIGDQFVVEISYSSRSGSNSEKLQSFVDKTFTCGGVGFLPKNGREVLLQQLRVTPLYSGFQSSR
jgi:hypothetical protein